MNQRNQPPPDDVVVRAVELYLGAWNENDLNKAAKMLGQCWREDAVIQSNSETISGRFELFQNIREFRASNPNDRAVLLVPPEAHHGWFRFHAAMQRPDNSRYSAALNVGEVGQDGRILRALTFFGPTPRG